MKTLPMTAIVALMTATIGLTAIAPTYAQETAAPVQAEHQGHFRHHNQGPRQGGHMGGGDFLGFERGAEAIEIAFVRLSHAIELTTEQQGLFDAFKTAALGAAADFATATESLRPAAPAAGETAMRPDMSERLENRIAFETAKLAALEAVQPAATAFFDSLTDEQKAELTPQRPDRDGMPGFGKGGMRHQGMHNGPMGAAPAPEAPTNG
ncbi:Spy/CpxP family protein refolding chaperone [Devosia sp.]|uniref:Spy/CpxP family protein refolding chaperone n=1 Tax=Devosia sp. TaxID=1871048 RepID=UPI002FC7EB99